MMARATWTRRTVVAAGLGLVAAPARAGAPSPRVVSLDWGLATTMVALGLSPVGVAERRLYADWVGTPALPPDVVDVGLRGTPSYEALLALQPDLILVNALNTAILSRLERIAPTLMNTIFAEERSPLGRARDLARKLGQRIGRGPEAEALVQRAHAEIAAARERLRSGNSSPVLPLNAVDGRHVALYGRGSLYHDVLIALGLRPAFTGPTSIWGHSMVGIADIAAWLPADVLVIEPLAPAARQAIDGPHLWRSLLAAKASRQFILPPAWAYGDIASAARFATLVADALSGSQDT